MKRRKQTLNVFKEKGKQGGRKNKQVKEETNGIEQKRTKRGRNKVNKDRIGNDRTERDKKKVKKDRQ